MVVALILARLLTPHDWGLAAMVMVFSGFVVVFTDSALGTALIQRTELSEGDRSTVFWTSAGVGLLLALTGIACSGPLARFYREPAVRPLFAALSVGFFITSLGATQMALLVRDMQFRRLELRQMAATVVGACTGITVALSHFGAWAIVGQQLGGGDHLDGAPVVRDAMASVGSRSRSRACAASAALPGTCSARTSSTRRAATSRSS